MDEFITGYRRQQMKDTHQPLLSQVKVDDDIIFSSTDIHRLVDFGQPIGNNLDYINATNTYNSNIDLTSLKYDLKAKYTIYG